MRGSAFRRLIFVLAFCVGAVGLSACGGFNEQGGCCAHLEGAIYGESVAMGQGKIKTYTWLDRNRNPVEVGLRISASALDGLPAADTSPPTQVVLHFPGDGPTGVIDHVMLNWNSHGHEPVGVFDKPHFDFHFYMVDHASVMNIAPTSRDFKTRASRLPSVRYVPDGYAPPPGPPATTTVPMMGLHWFDLAEGIGSKEYDFQHAFLFGSWDGRMIFMEPMITPEWLSKKQTFRAQIKQPAAYQLSGFYPTTYSYSYDRLADEFVIALGGMSMRRAS
jgi:hypothetical protein